MAKYYPNLETAEKVKSCVRAGIENPATIAVLAKITESQLIEHYQFELGYTDDEDLAIVADVALEMALCGKFPHMTQWWMRQKGGAIWQEKKEQEVAATINPIVVVLKGDAEGNGPDYNP